MSDFGALRTPLGLLKILITAVLMVTVSLAAFGNDGERLTFGVDMEDFLGVGVSIGLAIVTPMILLAYVAGGSLLALEALLSLLGGALLIFIGVYTLDVYSHPELGSPAGKTLSGMCMAAGGLFIVNLLFVLKAVREH